MQSRPSARRLEIELYEFAAQRRLGVSWVIRAGHPYCALGDYVGPNQTTNSSVNSLVVPRKLRGELPAQVVLCSECGTRFTCY